MTFGLDKVTCRVCSHTWNVAVTWDTANTVSEGLRSCPNCGSYNIVAQPLPLPSGSSSLSPSPILTIKYKRLTETAKAPTKAYPGDLGWDLYADTRSTATCYRICPHETKKIPTGLALELPYGWGALIRPRSSQGNSSIHVFGGVMDNSYRGEWCVLVHNASHDIAKIYSPGDKIGQLVLIPLPETTMVEVFDLSDTERAEKGYGSSGQ